VETNVIVAVIFVLTVAVVVSISQRKKK